MNQLSNGFALLELDVGDDKEQTATVAATDNRESVSEEGNAMTKGDCSGEMILPKSENGSQQSPEMVSGDYRLPLVWIDLEMTDAFESLPCISLLTSTQMVFSVVLWRIHLCFLFPGLDIEVDRILEIACIITDGNLTKSIEGPDLVIHQSKDCLDRMGEWCQSHHGASGLTEKVLQSTISEREAEEQVIEFVKRFVGTYKPRLAGNSVYMDFLFLKKYMPDLASLFPHTLVDVSSVRALCLRWYPRDMKKAPMKEKNHRAMDDIKESIAELKFYKENMFKSKTKK